VGLSAVTKLAAIKTVNGAVTNIGAALASYTQLFSGLLYIG
jgi:POT family proton-dependent oligopeptide transporter